MFNFLIFLQLSWFFCSRTVKVHFGNPIGVCVDVGKGLGIHFVAYGHKVKSHMVSRILNCRLTCKLNSKLVTKWLIEWFPNWVLAKWLECTLSVDLWSTYLIVGLHSLIGSPICNIMWQWLKMFVLWTLDIVLNSCETMKKELYICAHRSYRLVKVYYFPM
jgi:hypothetical protein